MTELPLNAEQIAVDMIPLSKRFKGETAEVHREAEQSPFMRSFFTGSIERGQYVRFLRCLHLVYATMEEALERHRQHPVVGPIAIRELYRVPSLEADLSFFVGADWPTAILPTLGAEVYAQRLRELSASQPMGLVSHAYTRYLGDLSGGQMIKKVVGRCLGLESKDGLAFYEFPDVEHKGSFKEMYRERLDGLPLTKSDADFLVDEAITAFRHNIRMVEFGAEG